MNETVRTYFGRILAGCSVSFGAYIYLKVGGPLGAVMFGVGLMAVLTFGFGLFTGQIKNFCNCRTDFSWLSGILLLNAVGCVLASLMVADTQVISASRQIVECRAEAGFLKSIATGAGCGFIMTLIVSAWKTSPWPLLIGIPAFILSGMTHSVADVFYYAVGWKSITFTALYAYAGTVFGNFLGGTVYKLGSSVRE